MVYGKDYVYVIPKIFRSITLLVLVGVIISQVFGHNLSVVQTFLFDLVAFVYFASEVYHEKYDEVKSGLVKIINKVGTFIFAIHVVLGLATLS